MTSRVDRMQPILCLVFVVGCCGCRAPDMALETHKAGDQDVYAIAVSPCGGMVAAGARDGRIHMWSVGSDGRDSEEADRRSTQSDRPLLALHGVFRGHTHRVGSLAFSQDGRFLVSSGDDSTLRFWSVADGELLRTAKDDRLSGARPPYGQCFEAVAVSPTAPLVATVDSDGLVRLWTLPAGELVASFNGWSAARGTSFPPPMDAIAFSPDGQLLGVGGADHWVCIWSVLEPSPIRVVRQQRSNVRAIAFSPDGSLVASGGAFDHRVRLWSVGTGDLVKIFGDDVWTRSISFSPDGEVLVATDWSAIVAWSVSDARLLQTLTGHTGRVWTIAFSPNGEFLFSGAEDGTVRVWDADALVRR